LTRSLKDNQLNDKFSVQNEQNFEPAVQVEGRMIKSQVRTKRAGSEAELRSDRTEKLWECLYSATC